MPTPHKSLHFEMGLFFPWRVAGQESGVLGFVVVGLLYFFFFFNLKCNAERQRGKLSASALMVRQRLQSPGALFLRRG